MNQSNKPGKRALPDNPPWGEITEWMEATETISAAMTQRGRFRALRAAASEIARLYEAIFPVMDYFCESICVTCPSPCCVTAKPWFDFKDLLFFAAAEIPNPRHQTIASTDEVCAYLGPAGCTLPRIQRPFICTWYICHMWKEGWRQSKLPPKFMFFPEFEACISLIKEKRIRLENDFVKAVFP